MPVELPWQRPLIEAYHQLAGSRTETGGLPMSEILAAYELWPQYNRDFFIAAMQRMNAAYLGARDG